MRRNTVLVGGEGNSYLYRLLPANQRGREQSWAMGSELLSNGDFETMQDGLPTGWGGTAAIGIKAGATGGSIAVRATDTSHLRTTATVTPGTTYLLSHWTLGDDGEESIKAYLSLTWRDLSGTTIATVREVVPTSQHGYHQFSMLATAPPTAVTAVISVEAKEGAVWFDGLSLHAVDGSETRP